LGLGYLVIWSVMLVQWRRGHPPQARKLGGIVSLCVFWLIMAVGLIALLFFRDKFLKYAHGAAGVLLLSAFIATTFCTAYVVGRELEGVPALTQAGLRRWCLRSGS
jgi:predicted permease